MLFDNNTNNLLKPNSLNNTDIVTNLETIDNSSNYITHQITNSTQPLIGDIIKQFNSFHETNIDQDNKVEIMRQPTIFINYKIPRIPTIPVPIVFKVQRVFNHPTIPMSYLIGEQQFIVILPFKFEHTTKHQLFQPNLSILSIKEIIATNLIFLTLKKYSHYFPHVKLTLCHQSFNDNDKTVTMTHQFLKTLESYKLIPRGITTNYQNLLLNREVNTTIVTGYNMLDPTLVNEYLKIYKSPNINQSKQTKYNKKDKKDNNTNQNKSKKHRNKNKNNNTNLFNNTNFNPNHNRDNKLDEMFRKRISYNKDTWKIPKE